MPVSRAWLFFGMLAAILPDFDLIYFVFQGNNEFGHRYYFSHKPFIYLALLVVLYIVYLFNKKAWFKTALIVFFVNVFLHFILDSYFVGISWLWPYNNKLFGLVELNYQLGGRGMAYFHHWYFGVEVLLWLLAGALVLKNKFKK